MSYSSYYSSSSRSVSAHKQPKPKPTISMPRTSADCRIILKRTDDENVKLNETILQNNTKIADLAAQLIRIQKEIDSLQINSNSINIQIKQNDINNTYLEKWLKQLETTDKQHQYFNRALEFIKTYDWSDPNVHDEDDEVEDNADANADADTNTNKDLPSDLFDYLELQFQPLERYTSDEIIKIAHYLKAGELIKLEDCNDTYSIMISGNYNHEYEVYIIGDIEHCDGTSIDYDEDACCHKRYANVITKFEDITLDDTSILNYTRVN